MGIKTCQDVKTSKRQDVPAPHLDCKRASHHRKLSLTMSTKKACNVRFKTGPSMAFVPVILTCVNSRPRRHHHHVAVLCCVSRVPVPSFRGSTADLHPSPLIPLLRRRAPCVSRDAPTSQQSRPSYIVRSDDDSDDEDPYLTRISLPTPSPDAGRTQANVPAAVGPDPPFLPDCTTCHNSGFVPCTKCGAEGVVRNERSGNVFYCAQCVGHKKLRCPACGGKCYMCE